MQHLLFFFLYYTFIVTKRTTIYQIRDFKLVVIILQLVVISTLIVFQIRFTCMFWFLVHNNNMVVIMNPNNQNWSFSPVRTVSVVVAAATAAAVGVVVGNVTKVNCHVRKKIGEIYSDTNWRSRKCRLASTKPRLKRNMFASDKLVKIGFQNPPEIDKNSLKYYWMNKSYAS